MYSRLNRIMQNICNHPTFPFGNGQVQVNYVVEQANAIEHLNIKVFDLPYSIQFDVRETGYGKLEVQSYLWKEEGQVWEHIECVEGDESNITFHIINEITNGYY